MVKDHFWSEVEKNRMEATFLLKLSFSFKENTPCEHKSHKEGEYLDTFQISSKNGGTERRDMVV